MLCLTKNSISSFSEPFVAAVAADDGMLGSAGGAGEAKAQPAFVRRRVSEAEHPSAGIGGHRIPSAGEVGGKKRVGYLEGEAVQGSKRARQGASLAQSAPGKSDGSLSKEEEEARQKREAAKQRVQQRTLAGFGFG